MTVLTCRPLAAIPKRTRRQGAEAEAWKSPLNADGLHEVLGLLRRWAWTAGDSEALLDDVARALDDVAPNEEEIEDIVQRFRGHLMSLVDIAMSTQASQQSAYAGTLVQRSRAVRAVEMPGDHRRAVLHLRQMGWLVSELLDQLVALDFVEGAA